jgi:hypothetical protein
MRNMETIMGLWSGVADGFLLVLYLFGFSFGVAFAVVLIGGLLLLIVEGVGLLLDTNWTTTKIRVPRNQNRFVSPAGTRPDPVHKQVEDPPKPHGEVIRLDNSSWRDPGPHAPAPKNRPAHQDELPDSPFFKNLN